MEQKLLIVTTFYNERERLEFTLKNMLRQSSDNFIHLIIDDGSTTDAADILVKKYIAQSEHPVIFEKHENSGINAVHMKAFQRTEELGCTHFMWLDCGDGLREDAVEKINFVIGRTPDLWLHLNGYYISDKNDQKIKMSSRSYLPYLKKKDQFLPFCFSISTYGHFVIPYKIYAMFNPDFILVDGFYYDAQIVGALSLNGCPHYFMNSPLSIIQDDQHYSVINTSGNSYRDNLLKLSEFAVADLEKRQRIADISSGIFQISIRQLLGKGSYFKNRSRLKNLKHFYKENGIKNKDRYRWGALTVLSLFYFCA